MDIAVLDEELAAFLHGDPVVREELPRRCRKALLAHVARVARDLEEELREEVVQRMWELLLKKPTTWFAIGGGPAAGYLHGLLRTAIKDVRACYTPPGCRTRLYRDTSGQVKRRLLPLSLDRVVGFEEDTGQPFHEYLVVDDDVHGATLLRLEVQDILDLAQRTGEPGVGAACRLIYKTDWTFTEIAAEVNVERSTLRRRIDRWAEREQLRAA